MQRLVLFICCGISTFVAGQQLDILAFDYYRKFGHDVHLGDCPDVSRPIENSKTTETVSCHEKQPGAENFQGSEIRHEAVVNVDSPHDVFSHLGLCDGNSASHLGLLYNSECITVDIAKSIALGDQIYNRAVFGTYRRGMVLLGDSPGQDETTPSPSEQPEFYTKYITFGSKEMVLVSLSYKFEADASSAKRIEFASEQLSDQLETLIRHSNNLESIKVMRLSTADRKYNKWSFPGPLANEAVTRVANEQRELDEVKLRVLSHLAMDPYYMNYVMWPFSGHSPGRAMQNDMLWQNMTLCEIKLHRVAQFGQQALNQSCVGAMLSTKFCKRLRRRLIRVQRRIELDVHSQRAKWFQLTTEDKETAAEKCSRVCRMNEHKMDRSVNRVLFQSVSEPLVGQSQSVQSKWLQKWQKEKEEKSVQTKWLQKWQKKKEEKLKGRRERNKKGDKKKIGSKRRRKNKRQRKTKTRTQS